MHFFIGDAADEDGGDGEEYAEDEHDEWSDWFCGPRLRWADVPNEELDSARDWADSSAAISSCRHRASEEGERGERMAQELQRYMAAIAAGRECAAGEESSQGEAL